MWPKYEYLFTPVKIGTCEIKNRIAMMPMGVYSERMMDYRDSSYTKDGADYYIARAKGGAGLIITGLNSIVPWLGLPYIGMDREGYIKNQKYLVKGVHKYGAKVFIQMTAGDGRSSLLPGDPAPSVMPMVWDPAKKSREMTVDEIHTYIENFAQGALIAQDAGVDGVEIHAVHEGYLLDQFAIAFFNHRTDEYGGSLENRLRFPSEIVKAVKAKCGKDYPVSLRYSVRSYVKNFNRGALPGETFKELGRDMEESRLAAKMLTDSGYDLLNCDNGTYDSWYWSHPPVYMPKACNLSDVAEIKKSVDVPVICAGKFFDPEVADKAIADEKIDIMGVGRQFLADQNFANKIYGDDEKNIRPCISCHFGCLSRIFQVPFKDISCAVNPAAGRESSYALTPAKARKKIAVVGGGIGGMEAARVCDLRGHEVHLFEKTRHLGGMFIAASAFAFKEEDKRLLEWYRTQISNSSIKVHLHTEFTENDAKDYDEIIVATGATEKRIHVPGFDSPNILCAVDALLHADIRNKNVIVIGGGLTGCEIAYELALKGCTVSIIEMAGTILNVEALNAANYNFLVEALEYHDVNVIKNATVTCYKDGVAKIEIKTMNIPNIMGRAATGSLSGFGKKVKEIPADYIIVSVGYQSNTALYEKIKTNNVHLVGDAKTPANLMAAIWASYETAMRI